LPTGTAEHEAGLAMVADRPGSHRITPGADKVYEVAEFVVDLREYKATPHVAQNGIRRSVIDGRTRRVRARQPSRSIRNRRNARSAASRGAAAPKLASVMRV
jgi:hypothetical protein